MDATLKERANRQGTQPGRPHQAYFIGPGSCAFVTIYHPAGQWKAAANDITA